MNKLTVAALAAHPDLLTLQHFFFDLDGTLADSKADVLGSLEQAYAHLGWQYDVSKLRIGPLLPDIIAAISPQLDEAQRQMVIKTFRAFYTAGKYSRTVLFPGVRAFLDALHAKGKTLYLATNKPKKSTEEVLEVLGLKNDFRFVGTPDFDGGHLSKSEVLKAMVKRFDINPATGLMIGDTFSDMEAGRAAGLNTMAYTGGYGGDDFERNSGADFVISQY